MQSIEQKILNRIRGRGCGSIYYSREFLDSGTRAAIDKALSRLTTKGELRRIARGVYSYPEKNSLIGELSPDPQTVAIALARRGAQKILPSGATAANLLGLTNQVPAKIEYLTEGPTRRIMIGKLPIILKQTTALNLATAGKITGTVIQALRFLRKEQVGSDTIEKLRSCLNDEEKQQLLKDIPLAPAWIGNIFRIVAKK
ncbi:MAG: DUF6088 family protein [Chthoniobacterales bacterium]